MKAIQTKYHGPTTVRGSRISASDLDGNRVIISMPSELNHDEAHRAAAEALCRKMGWTGVLAQGGLAKTEVFVFVDHWSAKPVPEAKPKKEYQPKTGAACGCKRGVQRDNCPNCEGTGWVIDFKAIRERSA